MGETAQGAINELASGGESAFKDVLAVIVEYIAPIGGLIVGWAFAPIVGGQYALASFANNVINSANNSAYWRAADLIGGLGFAGIYGVTGGYLWSTADSRKFKDGKTAKLSAMVIHGVLRFIAGVAFGMAIWSLVWGLTYTWTETHGFLDNLFASAEEKASEVST